MPDYRLYLLNARGNFCGIQDLSAASDAQAMRAAGAIKHPQGVEIWCSGRKVGVLQPGWSEGGPQSVDLAQSGASA